MYEPAIKWSGSKRSQASEIIAHFPKQIDTYYEPFCGGCSVLARLINSDIKVNKYVCSDLNEDLINLWQLIKDDPKGVANHYAQLWKELNTDDNKDRKRDYFNKIRDRYNQYHDPKDFMFIMRTTTNGMPRYNSDGAFNNSFHITRNGIIPSTLRDIVCSWSNMLNTNNVEFNCCSYSDIKSNEGDVLYLDPPYFNTKGMYYGTIDYKKFFDWMRSQQGEYYLSFDGISGKIDNTVAIPEDLYNKHLYLKSGKSSFRRIHPKECQSDVMVYESLYMKNDYKPEETNLFEDN